jgi:septum formation protein
LPFEVHPSPVNETYDPDLSPTEIVQQLALRKARDIASRHSDALVIGADTIVVFRNKILEKPSDKKDAQRMLRELSNQRHQVYTGVALCKVNSQNNITETKTFVEITKVIFGTIDPQDISTYVESGSPMDKAGSYGIQDDFGAIFVKKIEGDYNNVVGFPLHAFYNTMRTFAPEYLSQTKFE